MLTEDDYFDFLMGVTANRTLIPDFVIGQLAQTALLFLGFRLDEWDFRVLFRSLMNQGGPERRREVQARRRADRPRGGSHDRPDRARRYLESYFGENRIDIYWGAHRTTSCASCTPPGRSAPRDDGGRPAGTNPYVGPRAFTRGETLYGRDREVLDLLDLVIAERIVLLYSPSGAGKTSLLQAGADPGARADRLRRACRPCGSAELPDVLERAGRPQPLRAERTGLAGDAVPATTSGPGRAGRALVRPTTWTHSRPAPTRATIVLVFDQFEEVLTARPDRRRRQGRVLRQLGEALRDRRPLGDDLDARGLRRRTSTRTSRRSRHGCAATFRLDLLGPQAALGRDHGADAGRAA